MPKRSIYAALVAVAMLTGTVPAQANIFWSAGPEKNSVADRPQVAFPSKYGAGDIIVSFADRRLYYVERPGRAISYPIAVPRPQSRWDGVERVTWKREKPSWTPTARMRRENPKLPAHVPGGDPRNPMGSHAIYLGSTLYRIHGTDAPHSIGLNVSQGCIRMHNAHVAELYEKVRMGARVIATYQRFDATPVSSRVSSNRDLKSVFETRR